MASSRKYNKTILVLDVIYALFFLVAIYHLTQKPGLPPQLTSSFPQSHIRSLNGVPVSTDDDIEFLIAANRIGDLVRLGIENQNESIIVSTPLVHYYSLHYIVITSTISLIIFILGMFVYLFRPQDPSAMIFHLASVTLAVALIGTKTVYAVHPSWLGYTLSTMFFIAYSFLPSLFVHFTFVFPRIKREKYQQWILWFYAPATMLALWQIMTFLFATATRSMEWFNDLTRGSKFFDMFMIFSVGFGILNFVHSYKTTAELSEKKKLRWILSGLCIGPAPFVLLWVLPHILDSKEWISEELYIIFLVLIPITFAISIVKYHVMDIDVIISRSTAYVITLGAVLAVYIGIVGIAVSIMTAVTERTSFVLSVVAAIVVALLFEPARVHIQQFVDKHFFRVRYNFRETQRRFVEDIKGCLDVQQLADLIVRRTEELIPLERIGFFTLREPSHRPRLLSHRNYDFLETHSFRFEVEKLKTQLKLPVALDDKIERGVPFESGDAQVFRRWGIALGFTMISQNSEILGFLVLGEKKSGARFTIEDVDLLNTVATQAGLAIERITLQQKLLLEHAEAQRLEELNRLKSYFVSSVSHDLKTPLTSIKMFAELLRSKKNIPSKEKREYLEIIEGESDRLTRLINNVLDFAKVERGVKEYHFSEIKLNELVHAVLRSLQYQFRLQKFTVLVNLSKKEYMIQADADAVTEALTNLFANAMKYSRERKYIAVSTFRRDSFVAIKVKDKGIGISKGDLKNIFEPFYRTKDAKAQQVGGTGLGLALVKDIIEAHSGKIEVRGVPGRGSTFTLLFPLKAIS